MKASKLKRVTPYTDKIRLKLWQGKYISNRQLKKCMKELHNDLDRRQDEAFALEMANLEM